MNDELRKLLAAADERLAATEAREAAEDTAHDIQRRIALAFNDATASTLSVAHDSGSDDPATIDAERWRRATAVLALLQDLGIAGCIDELPVNGVRIMLAALADGKTPEDVAGLLQSRRMTTTIAEWERLRRIVRGRFEVQAPAQAESIGGDEPKSVIPSQQPAAPNRGDTTGTNSEQPIDPTDVKLLRKIKRAMKDCGSFKAACLQVVSHDSEYERLRQIKRRKPLQWRAIMGDK